MQVYKGIRITKCRNWDETSETKGDMDYVPDVKLPDLIQKARFHLSKVKNWEEYKRSYEYFTDTRKKVEVYLEGGYRMLIIEDIDRFDVIMETYYEGLTHDKLL